MKTFTFIITLAIGLSSTFAQKENLETINLSGKIPMAKGKKIYINAFKSNKMVALDSSIINKKGKYDLNFSIPNAKEFYSISLSPKNYALLILGGKSNKDEYYYY